MDDTHMTYQYFGIEWQGKCFQLDQSATDKYTLDPYYYSFYKHLENSEFGTVCVTDSALERIAECDWYKFRSLIFEHKCTGTKQYLALMVREEEKHKAKWGDKWHKVFSIDDFLNTFPVTLSEKKQRALYLLYLQHNNYGDEIKDIKEYMLFAKNTQEYNFILQSMLEQGLLCALPLTDIAEAGHKRFCIADAGWKELETIIKIKKAAENTA